MNPGRKTLIDADAKAMDIAKRVAFTAWLALAVSGLLSIGSRWLGYHVLGGWLLGVAVVVGAVFVLAMVFLTVCVFVLAGASRKKG